MTYSVLSFVAITQHYIFKSSYWLNMGVRTAANCKCQTVFRPLYTKKLHHISIWVDLASQVLLWRCNRSEHHQQSNRKCRYNWAQLFKPGRGGARSSTGGWLHQWECESITLFLVTAEQTVNDLTGTECRYLSVQGLFLPQEGEAACFPSSCRWFMLSYKQNRCSTSILISSLINLPSV